LVPLRSQVSEYRLILNPDVVMAEDALRQALQFMEQAPECGLLAPAVTTSSGTRQYLCRRLPGIAELLLRGFAPQSWRRRFEKRLHYYEMRDRIGCAITAWDPPLVSGCFMLLRSEVMERTGGFDPGYFLYFEDYDLSLRAAAGSRPVYRPGVRIVHHGGGAAHKGWRHVLLFARSACRFFRRHYGRRTDAA
ncbi:MAG: glycosyltransferase, partial [Candidatus Competibacterales bacterium]|nr:glycosyltransferase [Candidatus Competibacterales bacterium]